MQIHQLSSTNKKEKKRVGRGGVHGVFCGRGAKGQKSRAGRNFAPIIRALFKRYPKKRGYRTKRMIELTAVFQLADLLTAYKEKEIISPKTLSAKKIISLINGKYPAVKILGKAEVNRVVRISGCAVSKTVRESVEKAGGQIIIMEKAKPLKVKKKKVKKAKKEEVAPVAKKKETKPVAKKEEIKAVVKKKVAKKAPVKKEKK